MTNVKGARLENAHVGFCNLKVEGYITNVQLVTATNSMMWIGFDITDRSGFTTNIRIVHEPVNIDISGVLTVHRKSGTLSQLDAQHSDTQGGSPWVNRWRGVRIRSQNRPKSSPTSRFLPFLWGNKIGQKGPGLRLLPDTEHRGN